MMYFLVGFVSGSYTAQEYDLPRFKPILHLLYFKLKEYFEKFEKVSDVSAKEKKEINEVFTRRYAVSESEEENTEEKNLKED